MHLAEELQGEMQLRRFDPFDCGRRALQRGDQFDGPRPDRRGKFHGHKRAEGFFHSPPRTGLAIVFELATTIALSVERPQAVSNGSREKSTMQPSRL